MTHLLRRLALYLLFFVTSALALVPLLWAFAASFTPLEKVFTYAYPFSWRAFFPVEFTLEAYTAIFTSESFGRAMLNTFVLGVTTVFLSGAISALAGFAFGVFNFRGKNLLFALVLFTFMVPFEVTVIPLYILINDLKWTNTWNALLFPSLANGLLIFLFRQFFAEIPQDIYDAARVDGAGWVRIFLRIALPLSKPALISAGLLIFLGQWDAFFWPLLVAPRPEMRLVQVAISMSVEEHRTLWNQLLAGSMLAAIVPILLLLPFQQYYVRGVTGTGLKE